MSEPTSGDTAHYRQAFAGLDDFSAGVALKLLVETYARDREWFGSNDHDFGADALMALESNYPDAASVLQNLSEQDDETAVGNAARELLLIIAESSGNDSALIGALDEAVAAGESDIDQAAYVDEVVLAAAMVTLLQTHFGFRFVKRPDGKTQFSIEGGKAKTSNGLIARVLGRIPGTGGQG